MANPPQVVESRAMSRPKPHEVLSICQMKYLSSNNTPSFALDILNSCHSIDRNLENLNWRDQWLRKSRLTFPNILGKDTYGTMKIERPQC
jgi:hypothetical protein